MKRMFGLVLAVLLLLSFSGCSKATSENAGDYRADAPQYEGVYDSLQVGAAEQVKGEDAAPVEHGQKLIRTMMLETETDDMDALLTALDGQIVQLGGYVESRNLRDGGNRSGKSYRYADLTVRIPAQKLDGFVQHIEDASNVLTHRETTDDVTLNYVATESRLRALEAEQERLLELLAQAKDLSDLLLIEERLTNVLTELEQVTSLLRTYDNKVNYATVQLSVTEVVEYSVPEDEMTVWQRIGSGFMKNLKKLGTGTVDFFVFIIVILPLLVPVALIGLGIFLFIRHHDRKQAKKRAEKKVEPPKESE